MTCREYINRKWDQLNKNLSNKFAVARRQLGAVVFRAIPWLRACADRNCCVEIFCTVSRFTLSSSCATTYNRRDWCYEKIKCDCASDVNRRNPACLLHRTLPSRVFEKKRRVSRPQTTMAQPVDATSAYTRKESAYSTHTETDIRWIAHTHYLTTDGNVLYTVAEWYR